MKKKILSMLLVGFMSLSMVACGGKEDKDRSTDMEVSVQPNKSETKEEKQSDITFTETVAVDNEYCKVTLTEIEPDNEFGYTIKVLLENKTQDTTLLYSVDSCSVNGLQVIPVWGTEVSAGKKANSEIVICDTDLNANNITKYTDIELMFRVSDATDLMTDGYANEYVKIFPYGEDKVEKFVREEKERDKILVDNEYVKITATNFGMNENDDFDIELYIENKSDYTIIIGCDEASVNGFMADPFWSAEALPHKNQFTTMNWLNYILEENGIENVENIEFVLSGYDAEDYMKDYFNIPISIDVKNDKSE